MNAPLLVRSAKLSIFGSGQYLDGWPPGNTRCCWFFYIHLIFLNIAHTLISMMSYFFIEKDPSYWRNTQNYIVFSIYGEVFANWRNHTPSQYKVCKTIFSKTTYCSAIKLAPFFSWSWINCNSICVLIFLSQMIFEAWKHRENSFWPPTHLTYAPTVTGQSYQKFYEIHLQEISRVW